MRGFDLIIVPDEEEPGAAEVLVEGSIDGKPYTFLLDTGAARSSVVWDETTSQFPSTRQQSSPGVFAARAEDLITVPSIELGPIRRQNFTLARAAATEQGGRSLIGMDLLKDYSLHFLFGENRVIVNSENVNESTLQALFLGKKFHPYIEVVFGAEKANAVWDTGAGITVVDLALIEKLPDFFQEDGKSYGTDSTGARMETPMYLMSGAIIANPVFPPHRCAGVDLSYVNSTIETPMDLILGYTTLSQANWVFDFPRRKWGVESG